MEYRACAEHYASLVILNRGSARREKPIELTEAARLNCEAVRAKLAEHKRELHSLTAKPQPSAFRHLRHSRPDTVGIHTI
jgi:hypothetical protein